MSIIFSDIDGTIYGINKKIHPKLKNIIKEAKDSSVMFNIATENGIFPYIKNLSKNLGAKYLITSNGASIYDSVKKIFLYESFISVKVANKLLKKAIKRKIHANWWNASKNFATTYTTKSTIHNFNNIMAFNNFEVIMMNEIINPIYKIDFYGSKENINSILKDITNNSLNIIKTGLNRIEVTMANVSKADAIKIICKKHNLDHKKAMTIGDSINDKKMLELTNYSYSMANSEAEKKKWAKFHTTTYKQNGLGMAIIDYMHRIKK